MHHLSEEVVLNPFSESEVTEFLGKQAPSIARKEAFDSALHERTDGLPLFGPHRSRTDVLLALQRSRRSQGGAERQLERIAVPDNLAAIIHDYIARTLE